MNAVQETQFQEDHLQTRKLHARPEALAQFGSHPPADQIHQIRHHPRSMPSQDKESQQKIPSVGGKLLSRIQRNQERVEEIRNQIGACNLQTK